MATSVYRQQAEKIQKQLELLQEQVGLLERLAEIEESLGSDNGVAPVPAPAPAQATKGQTKKATTKKATAPKAATANGEGERAGVQTDDGKVMDLPTLLETIGQQVNKPLMLPDFVTLVRKAGYNTKAKDFSNMVYQALLKLCKRGKFEKNAETRAYVYVGQKVA
jgi:TolA-binding protein